MIAQPQSIVSSISRESDDQGGVPWHHGPFPNEVAFGNVCSCLQNQKMKKGDLKFFCNERPLTSEHTAKSAIIHHPPIKIICSYHAPTLGEVPRAYLVEQTIANIGIPHISQETVSDKPRHPSVIFDLDQYRHP